MQRRKAIRQGKYLSDHFTQKGILTESIINNAIP